jgi:hypothetical protein
MVAWKSAFGLACVGLWCGGQAEISQAEEMPWGNQIVGMIDASDAAPGPFTYYDDGSACRRATEVYEPTAPLCDSWFSYTAPGNNWAAIRGIAWHVGRKRTATWYSDSTTSEGNSISLALYAAKAAFSRPLKPTGGTFSMSELIEVAIPCWGTTCRHHYYWKSNTDGQVYRTVGTRVDGDAYNAAAFVTTGIGTHGPIRGIVIWYPQPAIDPWWTTFYQDGYINMSDNQYELDQP